MIDGYHPAPWSVVADDAGVLIVGIEALEVVPLLLLDDELREDRVGRRQPEAIGRG